MKGKTISVFCDEDLEICCSFLMVQKNMLYNTSGAVCKMGVELLHRSELITALHLEKRIAADLPKKA